MTPTFTRTALSLDDRRHLLRRLAFSATPSSERATSGRSSEAALDVLIAAARRARVPAAYGVRSNHVDEYGRSCSRDDRRALRLAAGRAAEVEPRGHRTGPAVVAPGNARR